MASPSNEERFVFRFLREVGRNFRPIFCVEDCIDVDPVPGFGYEGPRALSSVKVIRKM